MRSMRGRWEILAWNLKDTWRVRLAPTVVAMALMTLASQLASLASNRAIPESETSSGPVKNSSQLPVGVILPMRLESAVSIKETHAGEALEGRIMQDVPLPDRGKLPARSKVKGSVLAVVKDSDGPGIKVTLQFNQIEDRGLTLVAATSLRAMASYQAVRAAQLPFRGPDEGTPSGWANTVQIGGDIRYGDGGLVRNHAKEKIGKGVIGGVLVYVTANPGLGCEGPVNGDNHLQALWVFSSDACGTYDMKGVLISHSGNTAPIGENTLHFEENDAKLEAGTALLLRVVAQP